MKRTFSEVAREIMAIWKKPYFGAVPYLKALLEVDSSDPEATYWFDKAGDLARYLLANMATFRGDDARRLKAELKSMLS